MKTHTVHNREGRVHSCLHNRDGHTHLLLTQAWIFIAFEAIDGSKVRLTSVTQRRMIPVLLLALRHKIYLF